MNFMRSPDLDAATPEQQWRVFMAERLKIGPWCTRVAVWAEINEAEGYRDEGPMAEVTPQELLDVYMRIEGAPTPSARYSILAEEIPERAQLSADKSSTWFDAIHGLTAPHIIKSVGQAAYELAGNGTQPWQRALDLGSGTGNVGAALLGHGDTPRSTTTLVSLDMEEPLLAIAASRYPEMQLIQGSATELPFSDASFDLAISGGMVYAMDPEVQSEVFREVSRVLTPGGIYLDGNYSNPYLHPDNTIVGPKHGLEKFIVSAISPRDILPPKYQEVLSPDEFAQYGLRQSNREYHGARPHETVIVRVLEKLPD